MELFDSLPSDPSPVPLRPGAMILPGLARAAAPVLLDQMQAVASRSPFRHLVTPGGATMSVAMTNCGELGWVSDRRGYRYEPVDPLTGRPWPPLPDAFVSLAGRAASRAGYPPIRPEACLINRYEPGARLTLHQDRDELDLDQPIVSVSLGLPAVFLFGGPARRDPVRRVRLEHGDVVVWGGASRLAYHGVAPLKPGTHAATGAWRYNLTFRSVSRPS